MNLQAPQFKLHPAITEAYICATSTNTLTRPPVYMDFDPEMSTLMQKYQHKAAK